MCKREPYVVGAVIVLAIAVVMFFPVMGIAGSLEPSAAPAPTMKTLDQIPPTWSQKTSGAARFELVLDGAAVLDKETGLVWEKSPSTTSAPWINAVYGCIDKWLGGRKGWHIPTVEQFASLVDSSSAGYPKLPAGHPFTGVVTGYYWTSTLFPDTPSRAFTLMIGTSAVSHFVKTDSALVWCVRGGQSYDGQ